jgi:hypothetical protein
MNKAIEARREMQQLHKITEVSHHKLSLNIDLLLSKKLYSVACDCKQFV